MSGFPPEDGRPSLLATTVKSALVVAGLSYVAANWLSSTSLDQQGLGRLAFDSTRKDDPLTTGSIGARANSTRLDPCLLPRPR